MRPSDRLAVVVTCEHATNFVPREFRKLFVGHDHVLHSHRGWDPGTLDLATAFSNRLGFPMFATEVSRLLVEVNRSAWHSQLFSEFSQALGEDTKQNLLSQYYFSHRNAVESWIASQITISPRVLHLSLHSFTPILNGNVRDTDIGLLYDPRRPSELAFCNRWQKSLQRAIPTWRVRKNYPYLGRSDGFTTYLRKRFSDAQYCGIELEINQKWVVDQPSIFKTQMQEIVRTTGDLVGTQEMVDP
jgi:predicted N-formylglutamate amidohydrolase